MEASDYSSQAVADLPDDEKNRLIDDRMRALASDLFLAQIDQAVGDAGADDRVNDVQQKMERLEQLRP